MFLCSTSMMWLMVNYFHNKRVIKSRFIIKAYCLIHTWALSFVMFRLAAKECAQSQILDHTHVG